jgi:hypothetical protein
VALAWWSEETNARLTSGNVPRSWLAPHVVLLERKMIMCKNETASTHTPNTPQARGEEQRLNRGAYQAPRLVVIGTAVELVQGWQGSGYDGNWGRYRDR